MAQQAEANEPRAMKLPRWTSVFVTGHFLNKVQGFCIAKVPSYFLILKTQPANGLQTGKSLQKSICKGLNTMTTQNGLVGYTANARVRRATASSPDITNARSA